MSASKADKSRWWIAIFLDDMPVGTRFNPGRLHLTLIPWFTTDAGDAEVMDHFSHFFENMPHFSFLTGPQVSFGPNGDVSVNLVTPTEPLKTLHTQCLRLFDALGAHWALKNPYVSNDFRPHIRRRAGIELTEGEEFQVKKIALVKARRQEDNMREVAAEVDLI